MNHRESRITFVVMSTVVLGLLATNSALAADSYKVLHRFNKGDGAAPFAGLTFDSSGNLYGTTDFGGAFGDGTVFQLAPNGNGGWTEHVVHNFCSATDCADGTNPLGGLISDAAGNLYGTATDGGSLKCGVVFRLRRGQDGKWTEKVLHDFCTNNGPDGVYPFAALVFDTAGNLYGTTWEGGRYADGTVFQVTLGTNDTWTEKILYSFCAESNCVDGFAPTGSLIFDSAGNLYGTTSGGGAGHNNNCSNDFSDCGTVFELIPRDNGTWRERVLHSFSYFDGYYPYAALTFDGNGNLYGTTEFGGPFGNGVVFELSPKMDGTWTETVIHPFYAHNAYPRSTLVFDSAGNLYGTAQQGGRHGEGIVFKLSPGPNGTWAKTVLHSFNGNDGGYPSAGVIFDSSGNLYGTAVVGGTGSGVVFEITP